MGGVVVGVVSGGGLAPLQVTLNANATPARTQAVLRNVAFRTDPGVPLGNRQVEARVSDGDGGTSSAAGLSLSVVAPNPPPAACISNPTVTRPNVRLRPVAGNGRLDVTVEAAPSDGQTNNPLRELRFSQDQKNARVTMNGATVAPGATVTIPPGTVTVSFSVEREVAGQPTHVPFVVVDSCGAWDTFVGGGTGAGF